MQPIPPASRAAPTAGATAGSSIVATGTTRHARRRSTTAAWAAEGSIGQTLSRFRRDSWRQAPVPPAAQSTICSAEIGRDVTVTPYGDSASSIAALMIAGVSILPPSPAPLIPYAV